MRLIPTILCGGAGSRLWPVSRELHPKPFIRLSDGESLLQKAFLRGVDLPNVLDVLVVTNRDLFFKMEDEFAEVNRTGVALSYILEPFGRNTAPAIATAALHVAQTYGEEAVLLALAADHLIENREGFAVAVAKAAEMAQQGKLVTFGIRPSGPETGYGYIEASGNEVLRFVEKPTLEKAKSYVESGRFLWNSGIFCFTAGAMIEQMKHLCPEVLERSSECMRAARRAEGKGLVQIELGAEGFAAVPDISVDYAVMEKSDRVAVVSCDIGWNDIGSWNAVGDLGAPDENGNAVDGEALLHDATGCYIRSDKRVVGAVGVSNLIIIDTPDALLVADKTRAQDVKHLFAQLKANGHDAHRLHSTVHRPWGTYTVLEEGSRFKIKRIEVKPGASLSLQMHHHRSEHWVVVSGMAQVINGDKELLINANESTFIPAGHAHRLSNPGKIDLVMIEVQSGDYVGEDDIVRLEDKYGRVG